MAKIRSVYTGCVGRHPERQGPVRLRSRVQERAPDLQQTLADEADPAARDDAPAPEVSPIDPLHHT